jgi:hypothetical protein
VVQPLSLLYDTVDVYLESYVTHFAVELVRWYEQNIVPQRTLFRSASDGRFLHSLGFAPALLNGTLGRYDAILFLRPDMIFKPGVIGASLAAANRSQARTRSERTELQALTQTRSFFIYQILFASQEWANMQCGCGSMCSYCLMHWTDASHTRLSGTYAFTGSGRKRVVDTLAWLPSWSFEALTQPDRCAEACTKEHNCVGCGATCTIPHDCCTLFLNEHRAMDNMVPLFGETNIGFLLPHSQHDSDPSKDANPLYSFAGRAEAGDLDSITSTYEWWRGGVEAI